MADPLGFVEPGGSTSWSNNVPDPLLSADTLPDFTYDLEASEGKQDGKGNYGKEVTAAELPVFKGIAGVSMVLEPGVMRELHWHPNADEWQYIVEGEVEVTLFGAKGRYRQERVKKSQVAYIPQGYGHSIESVGKETAKMVIGLNAGVFQKIDLSQFVASQPDDVLRTNLNLPQESVEKLPKKDYFFTDGKPE